MRLSDVVVFAAIKRKNRIFSRRSVESFIVTCSYDDHVRYFMTLSSLGAKLVRRYVFNFPCSEVRRSGGMIEICVLAGRRGYD